MSAEEFSMVLSGIAARLEGLPLDGAMADFLNAEYPADGPEFARLAAFLGVGFDAAVVHRVERRGPLKRWAGHPWFVASALRTWASDERRQLAFAVEDDERWRTLCELAGLGDELATLDLAAVDLTDLSQFDDGAPHELFQVLRNEAPVFWHEPREHTPGGEGFWCLTRHEDVQWAARESALFSSASGGDHHW